MQSPICHDHVVDVMKLYHKYGRHGAPLNAISLNELMLTSVDVSHKSNLILHIMKAREQKGTQCTPDIPYANWCSK